MKVRLDNHDKDIARLDGEVKSLRDAKHDHNGRIHTVEGVLVGIEKAIETLTISTNSQSEKTGANTLALGNIKVRADTIIVMGLAFFAFCGFVGGQLLGWW